MARRVGNLWHMPIDQLIDIIECKKIVPPVKGSGKVGQLVKKDYIQAIEASMGGAPGTKRKGIVREAGHLSNAEIVMSRNEMEQKWGGDTNVEACIGTSLPSKCLIDHKFVEKFSVPIPDVERLWSTVVGYTLTRTACTMSVWSGVEDTLIVQNLGADSNVADMWTISMNRRPNPPRWADANARILYEPIVVKDRWICKGANGNSYAFCLVQGIWNVGLEYLFKSIPEDKRDSYPMVSLIGTVVQRVTDFASSTSCAGRDTQHYAWRFEKDPYGSPWLVLSLMPLPYFFSTDGYEKVPADKLVRSALDGHGGMYLTTLVVGK